MLSLPIYIFSLFPPHASAQSHFFFLSGCTGCAFRQVTRNPLPVREISPTPSLRSPPCPKNMPSFTPSPLFLALRSVREECLPPPLSLVVFNHPPPTSDNSANTIPLPKPATARKKWSEPYGTGSIESTRPSPYPTDTQHPDTHTIIRLFPSSFTDVPLKEVTLSIRPHVELFSIFLMLSYFRECSPLPRQVV